jgi:hypothetical protein
MFPVHPPLRMRRLALLCLVCVSLVGCGGGGGDDGGGGGGGGGFTLGATTANFQALRNGAQPADVRIPITVTGSAVAVMGAAFVGQTPPSWLSVNIEGTGRNLTLVLQANNTFMNAGQYTSTVTIGSADSASNILSTQEVRITYDLVAGMVVSATPLNNSFVFGSSRTTQQVDVSIGAATGKSWTITSNVPWLSVPAGTQQGDANLALTLNGAATGTAPGGTAVAHLTVQNTAQSIDRHVITVNAQILAPLPVLSVNPVQLGGFTGLEALSQQVEVSLNTGTNVHPWTLTLDTAQSPGWVVSDVSAGSISETQHSTVTFGVGSAIGAPGNYSGNAHFDVTVAGQTFRTSIPITLKWHGQRLVPEQLGVAFSSFPSGLRPGTRTLRVAGSRGVNDAGWTAVSNQSWLTATPAGVTGGNLVLTANPMGLAADQLHVANVTLSSTSANIERDETIRVGLWVGSANPDPGIDVSLPAAPFAFAVNPVEPYAYLLIDGEIHVYNVYTGAELPTFTGGGAFVHGNAATSMDVSSDGSTLYVANGATAQVLTVNAATGNILGTYQSANQFGNPSDAEVRYSRANGYPVLWTPFGDSTVVMDLEAGAPVQQTRFGSPLFHNYENIRALMPDGSRLFTVRGATTSTSVSEFTTAFGVLGGRTLEINVAAGTSTGGGGFVRGMCVSNSGSHLYAHDLGTLGEVAIDVEPRPSPRVLPHPADTSVQALDCHWNGRLYVGISTFSVPQDNVLVFDAAGNNVDSFLSGPDDTGTVVGYLKLSGDGRRVISSHVISGTVSNPNPTFSVNFYDVPP